jgi:hypothetical protein
MGPLQGPSVDWPRVLGRSARIDLKGSEMPQHPGYASFIQDCRRQREQLQDIIDHIEAGVLGVGLPVTLPEINEPTRDYLHHLKRSVAELDKLIRQYEERPLS